MKYFRVLAVLHTFYSQAYEKRISMDNDDIDGEYTQRKAVAKFLAKVCFSVAI